MNCECHKWGLLVFGALLIVFTFVMWNPAKWIIFAIGVVLVLHFFFGDKCFCKPCGDTKVPVKSVPVKKKK